MPYILTLLALTAVLFLSWRLSIRGREDHPKVHDLRGWSYAHRGLHGEGIPENSMAAFRAALENGYGIELDIHLLADGELAVIHDSKLSRTTAKPGVVEDLRSGDLAQYALEGTKETIPLFREVLSLYAGKAPLIIELKVHENNFAALTEAACKLLEGYKGDWCMESFDPRCLLWLKKHRPEVIRGQLTENYFKTPDSKLPALLKWILKCNLVDIVTRPDFVAYRYADRHDTRSNRYVLKHLTGVTWTIQTQEEYDTAVREGWIPIFEGFRP